MRHNRLGSELWAGSGAAPAAASDAGATALGVEPEYGASDDTLTEALRPLRVVCIGGGTGMPTVLRGLRPFTRAVSDGPRVQLTAIVTMADDGGSSGWLRREMAVLPPGDVRNCLVALSRSGRPLTRLFQYRFGAGAGLQGHTVGNLMLTALSQLQGDFLDAVRVAGALLGACGRVLPSTLRAVQLVAEMDDGRTLRGEQAIVQDRGHIARLALDPASPPAAPGVISAIEHADLVVLGPGSLFTSLIPNLLVSGVAKALASSPALKVLALNLMTEPGETDGFDAADHVRAVVAHAGPVVDCVLAHDGALPARAMDRYGAEGSVPVALDERAMARLGVGVVKGALMSSRTRIRHDPQLLGQNLIHLAQALRRVASA